MPERPLLLPRSPRHGPITRLNTKQLDAEIRAQIDQFLVSISALVRQAAVEAVREALGDTSGTSASTRRRSGRPRKAVGASSAPKATKGRAAAKAKPGRRVRRSTADVEKVAAQVLAHVRAHAGQRLEEIGRGLKVATAGLKRPIQGLIAAGSLRTEGQRRGTRYFAGGKGGAKPKAAKPTKRQSSGRKAGKRAGRKVVEQVAVRPAKKVGKRAGKKGASKVVRPKAAAAAESAA